MTRVAYSREPVKIGPRRRLTAKTRQMAYDTAQGLCGRCGLAVGLTEAEYDHVIPRWFHGRDGAEELVPLHPACHKRKTKLDKQDIGHCKRLIARREGRRRQRAPIASPGFNKRLRRKMSGEVVVR